MAIDTKDGTPPRSSALATPAAAPAKCRQADNHPQTTAWRGTPSNHCLARKHNNSTSHMQPVINIWLGYCSVQVTVAVGWGWFSGGGMKVLNTQHILQCERCLRKKYGQIYYQKPGTCVRQGHRLSATSGEGGRSPSRFPSAYHAHVLATLGPMQSRTVSRALSAPSYTKGHSSSTTPGAVGRKQGQADG